MKRYDRLRTVALSAPTFDFLFKRRAAANKKGERRRRAGARRDGGLESSGALINYAPRTLPPRDRTRVGRKKVPPTGSLELKERERNGRRGDSRGETIPRRKGGGRREVERSRRPSFPGPTVTTRERRLNVFGNDLNRSLSRRHSSSWIRFFDAKPDRAISLTRHKRSRARGQ